MTIGAGCLLKGMNVTLNKGIIFYTDSRIEDPIKSSVELTIRMSGLPITSVSLDKPCNLGNNIVLTGLKRGYKTYILQIITALEESDSDYVFFCEHDVLYPEDHFSFNPTRDDIYYYNENILRWPFKGDKAITYDRLLCLSGMICNRELALRHYGLISDRIYENEDQFDTKEPDLARKWGYEPGTKKRKRGGLTDEDFETFRSENPIIDIRHKGTFSPPKVTLDSFKHKPNNWREVPISDIPYWDLKEMYL